MRSYAGSDRGRRENNEDVVWADDDAGLYIVVDGMGGHRAGEHAASIARDVLRRRLTGAGAVDAGRIKETIAEANNEIYATAQKDLEKAGMGCVLTVAVLQADRLLIGHVGDTRLYRLQGGEVKQLTRDHSPVGDLQANGLLTEEEARHHPRRHYIYRDVGTTYRRAEAPEFIDVYETPFSPDMALVLCTDGLTEVVGTAEICSTVYRHAGHPDRAVTDLIDLANARGGRDNISVIVVEGDGFDRAADGSSRQGSPEARATDFSESRPYRRRRLAFAGLILVLLAVAAGLLAWNRLRTHGFLFRAPRVLVVQAGAYNSITEALRAARPGDSVKVTTGIYHETMWLRRAVQIFGEGKVQLMPSQFPAVVAENVDQAGIRGFEIHAPEGASRNGAAVVISDAHVVIGQCQIRGGTRVGVEIRGAARSLITGSTISGHEIGILIYGDAAPRIEANQILDNSIGVLAAERSRPAIRENQIVGNHKREVIIEETSIPTRFDENVIGHAGVEVRNPALEKTLDLKNNIYLKAVEKFGGGLREHPAHRVRLRAAASEL